MFHAVQQGLSLNPIFHKLMCNKYSSTCYRPDKNIMETNGHIIQEQK